ncbi:AAA family ATPase [bacterium]|nr:AAA family ATPase [bacterium]
MSTTLRFLSRSPNAKVRLMVEQGRLWVVKEVGPEMADALAREAQALVALQDLAGLPDLLSHSGHRLERSYLPGRTLRSLCRRQLLPRLQVQAWLERLRQLLEQIHARGHWHGDVCPANVLIGPDQSVYLLDWGGAEWGTPPYRVSGETGPAADWRGFHQIAEELVGGQPGPGQDVPRLLGREDEIARLRDYWRDAPHSEASWVGISAPSGGGKSALLEEMAGWSPHAVLARCSTLTCPLGYQLFQSLLEQSGWAVDGQGMSELSWLQFQVTFPGAGRHHQGVGAAYTSAPLLISEGWTALLTQMAARWPLLLLLDDVQWMDPPTQQLLEALSRRPIPGLMVVLAWREQEWQPPEGLYLRAWLRPPPLQPHDVLRWSVREGLLLEAHEAERMAQWSGGNPLLISEWLRNPGHPDFSAKVGGLLRQRIGQVPGEYLPVLQVAALVGRDFESQPLEMAGPWLQALSWAEDQQLILPGLRFSHDQVREAILDTLSPEQRGGWHSKLGQYYAAQKPCDPGRCAFHYWEGGDRERAAPLACSAARQERQRSASSAAAYYEMFCQFRLDPGVIAEYSEILEMLGQHETAERWLKAALTTPTGRAMACELHLRLSRHAYASGKSSQAYFHASQAWSQRRSGLLRLPPNSTGPIFLAELEAVFAMQNRSVMAGLLLRRVPVLFGLVRHDVQLQASLLVAWVSLGLPLSRKVRSQLLVRIRREPDPLMRAKGWVRAALFHFRHGNGRFHERLLRNFASTFEALGQPWETYMACAQLGLYAMVRGDFARLHQWAARIREFAGVSQDASPRAVALHFDVFASGARVFGVGRVLSEPPVGSGLMTFHQPLALARVLLRQGKLEQAWALVEKCDSLIPLDVALIEAFKASLARQWADATPRRWKGRRLQLYLRAQECAQRALKTGPAGRMFSFQARREMSLALVGLGQGGQARPWMLQSIEEAARFEATYEEALSRQAWGRVGSALGWPSAQQQAGQGQQMLEQLGARWDLSPEPCGLPLHEVSLDASGFLQHPTPEAGQRLARWVEPAWIVQLGEVRRQALMLQQQRQAQAQELQAQHRRWQAFLQNGPLAVQRFSPTGQLLEGHSVTAGEQHRVDLTQGEYAILTLPLERAGFAQCKRLLQAEVGDLTRLLRQHQSQAKTLTGGLLTTRLVEDCAALEQWHLGSQPASFQEAWFGKDLEIEQQGEIPWPQLGPEARTALLGVLREALQNCRKHRPLSKVRLCFQVVSQDLLISLEGSLSQTPAVASPRSFGFESMRFRTTLAGGRLQLGADFSLRLWLPLSLSKENPEESGLTGPVAAQNF